MATDNVSLALHYQSPWLRQLPHHRSWLPAVLSSCRPSVNSLSLRWRRIAFLFVTILRIIEWVFFVFVFSTNTRSHEVLIPILWLVVFFLAFLLVAWNLHLIVEAEGERRIWRVTIPNAVFTVFLWWIVVVHVFLIGLEVTGMVWFYGGTVQGWTFWTLVIILVAWVAGRKYNDGGVLLR